MRKRTVTFCCGHEGCREFIRYEADGLRDSDRLHKLYGGGQWRCVDHTKIEHNLTPDNLKRVTIVVATKREHGVFWEAEGILSSGFIFGPGFKARTDLFPPGTRLVVTAEIVLPAQVEREEARRVVGGGS